MQDSLDGNSSTLEQSMLSSFKTRSQEIADSVAVLAGQNSTIHRQVLSLIARFDRDWERISSNRGINLPVIALVGERNSGKSTLTSLLVKSPGLAEQISMGELEKDKTDTLTWIGPERPGDLAEHLEKHWYVDARNMSDLKEPYMLLDAPGMGDTDPGLRQLAEAALCSAQFKVLVVDYKRVSSESYKEYMDLGQGSVILPVVRLSSDLSRQYLKDAEQVASLVEQEGQNLQEIFASSSVLPAVAVPDLDACGNRENAETMVRQIMQKALQDMFAAHPRQARSRVDELSASWERFCAGLRQVLEGLFSQSLRLKYQSLEEKTENLPALITRYLLNKRPQLRHLVKLDMRKYICTSIPSWAVPFNRITGLICLTAKAWDGLIMGLGGSLPSLTKTGLTAFKNAKNQLEAQYIMRERLKNDLQEVVNTEISGPVQDFKLSVERSLQTEPTDNFKEVDFEIQGSDEFIAAWEKSVAASVKEVSPAKKTIFFCSLLATLSFVFLFFGPIVHIFGKYVSMVFSSWQGNWSIEALRSYPLMPFSFWFTMLIMSFMPVCLISMAMVYSVLNKSKLDKCIDRLEEISLETESGQRYLKINILDPKVQAAKKLLTL